MSKNKEPSIAVRRSRLTEDEKTQIADFQRLYDAMAVKRRGTIAAAAQRIFTNPDYIKPRRQFTDKQVSSPVSNEDLSSILYKANSDACLLLGIRREGKLQNPGLTYGLLDFAGLVREIKKIGRFGPPKSDGSVDFLGFLELSAAPERQEEAVKPAPLTDKEATLGIRPSRLSETLYFLSASFHQTQTIRYQGLFILHAGIDRQLDLEIIPVVSGREPLKFSGTYGTSGGIMHFQFTGGHKKKLYLFQISNLDYNEINYLHGVFAGDSEGQPTAGEIFLEKAGSEREARTKLGSEVPPIARYLLHQRQFRPGMGAFTDLQQMEEYAKLKQLNKWVGTYEGFYLSQPSKNKLCSGRLFLFEDGSVQFDRFGSSKPAKGVVYFFDDTLFILLHYASKLGRYRFSLILSEVGQNPSQLRGTYGNGRDEYMPNVGRIIFRQVATTADPASPTTPLEGFDTQSDIPDFLQRGPFHEGVLRFLKGKSTDEYTDDPAKLFANEKEKIPLASALPVSETELGEYEAYILQFFPNREHHFVIQCLRTTFRADRIEFTTESGHHYSGQLYVNGNHLLASISRSSKSTPEMFICLQNAGQRKFLPNAAYTGVYAGIGQGDSILPSGGRIVLYRCEGENSIAMPKDYNLIPHDATLKELLRRRRHLLDFFTGRDDEMVEGYKFFRDTFFIPLANDAARKACLNELKGVYLSFKLDKDRKHIDIQPLRILRNWEVWLMSTVPGRYYYGVVNIFGMMGGTPSISLNFHVLSTAMQGEVEEGHQLEDYFSQSLFHKKSVLDGKKYLNGVHTSRTISSGDPFCCRQVLVKVSEKSSDFDQFKDRLQRLALPIFKEKKDLDKYQQYEATYPGLLTWLMGEAENLIVVPRPLNDDEDNLFRQGTDYGLLHIIAASYFAQEHQQSSAEDLQKLALEHWYKAVNYGFKDGKLLDNLLKAGRLPGLQGKISPEDMLPSEDSGADEKFSIF